MRRKILAAVVLVTSLSIVPTAAALTTSFPPEGGMWYHGFGPCSSGTCTQSIYVHPTRTHTATAVGKTTIKAKAAPGRPASAFSPKASWGNKVYYGFGS